MKWKHHSLQCDRKKDSVGMVTVNESFSHAVEFLYIMYVMKKSKSGSRKWPSVMEKVHNLHLTD